MVQQLYEKRRRTYKLIIMDFAMPVCNGVDATVRIKKYLSERVEPSKISFICCLTSYKDRSFKDEAIGSGMDGFITKPIFKPSMSRLLKAVGLA